MANDYFIKLADSYPQHLTGSEKAAILFGELGFTGDTILNYLSDAELRKLKNAMKRLGKNVNWSDEVSALQEANEYGIQRGIYRPIHSDAEIAEYVRNNSASAKENSFRNMISQNPDAIANALRAWMSEE